jgi:hypothetical protein
MKGLLCLLLLGVLSGCSFREDKLGNSDAARRDSMRPWFTNLSKNLFGPKCFECHNGPGSRGKIDLTNYTAILGVVDKGHPESSRLYTSLTGVGGDMPLDRPALAPKEIKMIYDWIKAQAPLDGKDPDPPPPPKPTFEWIYANVITPKCFNCHKGPGSDGGINLEHYEDFATDETIIAKNPDGTGDPEKSLLWDVLKDDFMPYKDSRTKLTAPEKKAVYDWIVKGAPKD